jgi:hypothetical protein
MALPPAKVKTVKVAIKRAVQIDIDFFIVRTIIPDKK